VFANLENIDEISFFNTEIGKIETNAFSNIKNISSLTFNSGRIQEFQTRLFNVLEKHVNVTSTDVLIPYIGIRDQYLAYHQHKQPHQLLMFGQFPKIRLL
jgi:hypothetical protein